MMQLLVIWLFVGAVFALPQFPTPTGTPTLASIIGGFFSSMDVANSISNDLVSNTSCKDIIFIAARGSEEPGNMVSLVLLFVHTG
jgi:hypothetical protein